MPASPPRLVRTAIDGQRLLAEVAGSAAGANVLFLGTTRGMTDGVATEALEYEAHEPMAAAALDRLQDEAMERFGLLGCRIEHRLGEVGVGEASVAIATSAAHRREAFAAAEWLMEQIKADVPIWKCELGPDGSRGWVHPDAMPGGSP
jgi:molybdopterin synthase catalytic subunit